MLLLPRIKVVKVHDYLKDRSLAEGTTVLVDRLWPRGVKKSELHLDCWLKEVAPSPELRAWFHHDPEKFSEFSQKYRVELAALADGGDDDTRTLMELVEKSPITMLYAAHDRSVNHAHVLAQWLAEQCARL
ncbi:DUF488 family protein [Corynebacterium sp. 3HC-13]|uniref:DUF488 domain-containing protein n=1 Tax=Corynebacterium poyangense TaxID=2684405 RepID=UPI001CCCE8B9|nr:DUF488 family protein [Corynebacterium poyangense]MBZ8176935.1 DUF488 family protein [Corynebacterium poyangense]